MPTDGSPRVIFRLAQAEYDTLVSVASAAGMSANEFARVLVLAVNEESRTLVDPSGPIVRVSAAPGLPAGLADLRLRRASQRASGAPQPNPTRYPTR